MDDPHSSQVPVLKLLRLVQGRNARRIQFETELITVGVILCCRLIQAKYNPNMVMTVAMPTMSTKDEDGSPLTYVGCQVTLQHRKTSQFGRANQKWAFDSSSGFISAFSSSSMDKGSRDRVRPRGGCPAQGYESTVWSRDGVRVAGPGMVEMGHRGGRGGARLMAQR